MQSWWSLGEGSGKLGEEPALYLITCPFCMEKGNFKTAFHVEKKKPNSSKKINFDTLECGNCKGYVQIIWSAQEFPGSRSLYDFIVQPWPIGKPKAPEHWPETVKRFWEQTHDSQRNENWDAAAMMCRSALQAALRDNKANGKRLINEIDDLTERGVLPKLMNDWAHELRILANESAHPQSESLPPDKNDVDDIVGYLDFLLQYLYDLPEKIQEYRNRKEDPEE